ncbi:hypothetical protein I6E18_12915 [Phocaeicola barnesiae]|uniref:hypothetical protein n=1 Tax=Phocaeicola barnesiae TaxID=376804 RepID=UPI001F361160|nr:hypothetical protein [Phocaeicola barnesiae]MCF2577040.1 hypothetical protein [Phocaeicola barnesiae]
MRRQFLGALLFAGTLAFTACQNETIIYVDENGNPIENVELKEGEGLLKINLSNTSENSRAVRPVGSSAAANNVNVVKIYVFKENQGTYKFDTSVDVSTEELTDGIIVINDFTAKDEHPNPTQNWEDHTDQTKTIKLKGLVQNSKYKFVAVGYNVADPGSNTDNPYGDPSGLSNGSTTLEYFTTNALASGKTDYAIEELFAGVSDENATKADKAAFNTPASVTLTRQVAGMLGYFDNVPTKINGSVVKYVRVYANDEYTTFKWPAQLLGTGSPFNGDSQAAVGSSNGEGLNKYLLMEFNMETIATNWNSGNPNEDTYTFSSFGDTGASGNETAGTTIESAGKAPLATGYTAPAGLKLVANSIFGGRYIIPYKAHVDSQTLTVELQDGSGNALKTLKVTTENGPTNSEGTVDGKYAYDIRCNNFYSIGKKLYTDNTGGDPDPDPTPGTDDPDEPIDLGSNTNIVVIINDAWEVLHNMGVEE